MSEKRDFMLVVDFGGQYCHLISRRIRDLGVYSEILPFDRSTEDLLAGGPKGIILSGGPASVYDPEAPKLPELFFRTCSERGIPVLGLCYGHQLLAHVLGGKVEPRGHKEYGKTKLHVNVREDLLWGLEDEEVVWMSHGDQVVELPPGCDVLAHTEACPVAAFRCVQNRWYGLQFHPEVVHTVSGDQVLDNFVTRVCGAEKTWNVRDWIPRAIEEIREVVGDARVVLGLSGGVDSSVTAALLHAALGDHLHSIFVNNGLLRAGEVEDVVQVFRRDLGFEHLHVVDAEELFLSRLAGVTDPEEKRKIIGHAFVEVFEEEAKKIEETYPNVEFLAQGTIFPDRVETAATSKSASKIKSHHNITLPAQMRLKLLEPLKDLYKDEVRRLGRQLGLPEHVIERHPFPGPGLAVRCVGAIDKEKLEILRKADAILLEEIKAAGIYRDLWQAFAVFLPAKTVGVMGDFRTYEHVCALRVVQSRDAMTANFAKLDWNLLERIASRIINEVPGFNRVVYDVSNKPPSTIEFE
ncbi:MAG: glutamine-hydrolyzing GMP synthase [Promethearchaeota archaeon]